MLIDYEVVGTAQRVCTAGKLLLLEHRHLHNLGSWSIEENVFLMESKWEPLVLQQGWKLMLMNLRSPKIKYLKFPCIFFY